MGRFFEELAKKLAERWVTLLVLPGALFLLTGVLGMKLGHRSALEPAQLDKVADELLSAATRLSAGAQVLLVAVALLGATGTGLAVQGLAGVTRAVWLGQWPRLAGPVRRWRVAARRRRWHVLVDQRHTLRAAGPERSADIDRLADRANRIALAEPGRPTWMGDRVHAVEQVAMARMGLDLPFTWPRLWLILPENVRTEITTAEAAFAAAVAAGTWSLPYLGLAALWWPSVVVGVVVGIAGWLRARAAVGDLTALSEAALDLHGRTLAVALGIGNAEEKGVLTSDEGRKITAIVRKGR